jgi:hypothetical protein
LSPALRPVECARPGRGGGGECQGGTGRGFRQAAKKRARSTGCGVFRKPYVRVMRGGVAVDCPGCPEVCSPCHVRRAADDAAGPFFSRQTQKQSASSRQLLPSPASYGKRVFTVLFFLFLVFETRADLCFCSQAGNAASRPPKAQSRHTLATAPWEDGMRPARCVRGPRSCPARATPRESVA